MEVSDYLLLDYIWEAPGNLAFFASPRAGEIFNSKHHEMSPCELANRLFALQELGMIEITHNTKGRFSGTAEYFYQCLINSLLVDIMDQRNRYVLELTLPGGEAWENYFRPDWSRYHSNRMTISTDNSNIETLQLEAQTKSYLQHVKAVWLKRYNVTGRTRWKRLKPWHATYWKVLPEGHRVTLKVQELSPPAPHFPDEDWFGLFRNWRTKL